MQGISLFVAVLSVAVLFVAMLSVVFVFDSVASSFFRNVPQFPGAWYLTKYNSIYIFFFHVHATMYREENKKDFQKIILIITKINYLKLI